MACTGRDCFEVRKLANKTWPGKPDSKNPQAAFISGLDNFLLRRHELVQSCGCSNSFPPENSSRQSMSSISTRFLVKFVRPSFSLLADKWVEVYHVAVFH